MFPRYSLKLCCAIVHTHNLSGCNAVNAFQIIDGRVTDADDPIANGSCGSVLQFHNQLSRRGHETVSR